MTFSPLTAYTRVTTKRSSRQGRTPARLIIHHTAGGDLPGLIYTLSTGPAQKSSTYLLGVQNADLIGLVPEEFRPWTSGSFAADGPAITVETQNTTGAPSWAVSGAQIERLAQLAADCSARYGWGRLNRNNVRGHRDYANTECPGPFIWSRMDHIITRANEIREGDDMPTVREIVNGVWNVHQLNASNPDAEYGRPAESPARRLVAACDRAGRAMVLGRRNAADIAGLTAAVTKLGQEQGIDPAIIEQTVRETTEAALKNVSITLSVDSPEPAEDA